MKNPKNLKERNLVKSAIMRVFSRSELRKQALELSILPYYTDPKRPRVKTWCECRSCKKPTPKSYIEIDHIIPKIALDSALEHMSWDEIVDNTWCDISNLQALCKTCHDAKSKSENALRRKYKKEKRV